MEQQYFIGLKSIPWSYLFHYFKATRSLLRIYQDNFVSNIGRDFTGSVIEIGGENEYNHKALFPKSNVFKVTNVNRTYEEYLDMTAMSLPDNSQECYLCVSVLEHVFEFEKGISEMKRTLKRGGKLIIVVPFSHPIHDEVDYWRFTPDSLKKLLDGFELETMATLGGKYSTIASVLQRPKGTLTVRNFSQKVLGFIILMLGKFLEKQDGFASGYGVCAVKK